VKLIFYTLIGMIVGGAFASIFASSSSWEIAILAVLFGLIGFMGAKNSPPSNQENNRPKKFQFSILRLLLATLMVALVFGLSRFLYDFKQPLEIIASAVIASALGGLTLICTKSDLKHIFNIIVILFGIFFLISVFSALYRI
jgi:hypothetical protein